MKLIFTTLLLISYFIPTVAQQNSSTSNHLLFKGVPIDGTLSEYVTKMKQNGFEHIGTEDGVAMLSGEFARYKECLVGVSTLKQKDLVHKIAVLFPDHNKWSNLSGNYFDLKEMLTEKYGEPADVTEKFERGSTLDDDNSKMYEVKFDRCKYHSIYETEKGTIQLSIENGEFMNCFVSLVYFDKVNSEIIKAKAKGDL